MLPHFPALLLLLVSPGGADHPPHPPWKELFRRLPSPREEVVSSRDKYEQKTLSWSGSSTTPEVKTTDQVLLAVSGHQIIPSVKDRHDKVFPDQLTLRSPAARDQQASESMGGSQEKSSASPYFSFPGPRQRMFAPDSLPAFPAGINKHHPLIKRSRRESRRNRSRTANKTLVIRLINDVSQRKSPVNRKQVHQVAYKRCAGGSKRDFLTNDTSSETCLGVITSTDPKQTTSSKFDVQDPGDNTSPSTGNVLFVSKGLTNKALKNGIASQEHQTDIINIRGNLTSRKTTGINTEAVLSRGDTAGHERPYEMTSRLRQGSGGSETIREEGDAHFSNSLSDSTFRNVLTKTYSSGSVGAAEQRREHLEPHQKSAVVVKGSDVAHLRHKMGERRGVVPRLPGELMAPVTSATKHHISGMLGSSPPYADTSLKTIPSVQTQGKDSFVYNRSFATSNSRGNSVQTLYFENKSVNSWRKHSRVKENRKVPHTSGVNNKKSNDSLFRVDRTDREDGESVEVPWVTWHKKRDTEEAQKNEFVLVNAQAGGGHSEMAVSQERDQRNNVDESRKNRVVRSINAGCKDTENVVCTTKVFPDNHNNNKLDTINDPGHVNADGPSRLRDDNSPGIPLRFLYKPNENDGTNDSESFRRRMEEDSVPAVVEVPVVRHRRERWSSVPRPEPFRLDHLRNHTIALPAKYSRIFTKNFPQIFSNYHSDAMNKRNHQSEQRPQQPDQEPSDDKRAVAHGSVADIKQDRKANRPLSLHANRSSVRAKGGNKHTRGERSFVKTPQQRHARSRNRAKRKGKSC
ncbi:uncharacterized protein LOC121872240 [Homarus americanus]|uniref:uncharacterized protein LOC121872240 n=1 Tax=Homarus americanus TaxID=6706 RepID=UPI001C48BC41|nr:uncharacterized protein LOC121872240 [Homarus americanus]